jgi:hypothetical protein
MIYHESRHGLEKAKKASLIIEELLSMQPDTKGSDNGENRTPAIPARSTQDAEQQFFMKIEVAAAELNVSESGRTGMTRRQKRNLPALKKFWVAPRTILQISTFTIGHYRC